MRYSDITIASMDHLIRAVHEAYSSFTGQVWWRGHRRGDWLLMPRLFEIDGGHNFEQNAIVRFKQRAISRHIWTPDDDDPLAWLFLMQHYRLPTRLLDWTESPLVAAYFAVLPPDIPRDAQPPPPSDGALYALSPYLLNFHQLSSHQVLTPMDPNCINAARHAFDADVPDVNFVAAILPYEVDTRLMAQQSVFTIHPRGRSIDTLESSDAFVVRYRIPAESKDLLRGQLKQLGMKESTIFPHLDHLAHEVSGLWFNPPTRHADA